MPDEDEDDPGIPTIPSAITDAEVHVSVPLKGVASQLASSRASAITQMLAAVAATSNINDSVFLIFF